MEIIDFNSIRFSGFTENEEILLDTGVVLAYVNQYDAWNDTVIRLFENHILGNDNQIFLFVNPTIINEVTHLIDRTIRNYITVHPEEALDEDDIELAHELITTTMKELVASEVLCVIDGDKDSVIKQLELYRLLGSADAGKCFNC